jgi:5-(carboxyamino)imidazole ribonucleotide synthase
MLVNAAQRMGYQTVVLDPDEHAPAAQVSQYALAHAYDDPQGIERLAGLVSRVTTEFENVPAQTLERLSEKVLVRPGADAVCVAQDRIAEKTMVRSCQLQTAPFHAILKPEDVGLTPHDLFPGILKTARLGYDGKGQAHVKNLEELQKAYEEMNAAYKGKHHQEDLSCVLEKKLPLLAEYSVILARNEHNQMVNLPIQCNQHINGVLHLSTAFPHTLSSTLTKDLTAAAQTIAQKLSYVGVLCVEFFLIQETLLDGKPTTWVVNEIAPRPHNSGHHSLDSCDISQFELQLRTLCGLPLLTPRQHSPCVMLNLLGDLWFDEGGDGPIEPPWQAVLALEGTHLHLYGKAQPRRARKMGHLNITGVHPEDTLKTLEQCLQILGLPPLSKSFLDLHRPLQHDH